MKQAFIAERDRQYKVTLDIEKLENRYQYLLSDNPACAGRFLREDYKPTPHDDSNIRRCPYGDVPSPLFLPSFFNISILSFPVCM